MALTEAFMRDVVSVLDNAWSLTEDEIRQAIGG
jgi:hypothetical protein